MSGTLGCRAMTDHFVSPCYHSELLEESAPGRGPWRCDRSDGRGRRGGHRNVALQGPHNRHGAIKGVTVRTDASLGTR